MKKKIVERGKIDTTNLHTSYMYIYVHDGSLSWLHAGTFVLQ
jgi:hypothetical protein